MFVCVWAAEEEWRGSGEAGRRLGECAQLLACVVVELRYGWSGVFALRILNHMHSYGVETPTVMNNLLARVRTSADVQRRHWPRSRFGSLIRRDGPFQSAACPIARRHQSPLHSVIVVAERGK